MFVVKYIRINLLNNLVMILEQRTVRVPIPFFLTDLYFSYVL